MFLPDKKPQSYWNRYVNILHEGLKKNVRVIMTIKSDCANLINVRWYLVRCAHHHACLPC